MIFGILFPAKHLSLGMNASTGGSETPPFIEELLRTAPQIRRWLAGFGVAAVDLDDCAHDVLFAALSYRASFDPAKGSMRTWLRAITWSVVAAYYREIQQIAPAIDEPDDIDTDTPEQLAADEERVKALAEVLATLDDSERELLRLRYRECLTTKEIAERLGIPEATVKSRLHRLLQRCAEAMRERGFDESRSSFLIPLFFATSATERGGGGAVAAPSKVEGASVARLPAWPVRVGRRVASSRPAWAMAGGLLVYLLMSHDRPERAASFTWTHSTTRVCATSAEPATAPNATSAPPSALPFAIPPSFEPVREFGAVEREPAILP